MTSLFKLQRPRVVYRTQLRSRILRNESKNKRLNIFIILMRSYCASNPEVSRSRSNSVGIDFRSAPVCKHASKARDPVDAFRSSGQSENGGVRVWACPNSVAVKMSMGLRFSLGQGTTLDSMLTKRLVGGYSSREGAVMAKEPETLRKSRCR